METQGRCLRTATLLNADQGVRNEKAIFGRRSSNALPVCADAAAPRPYQRRPVNPLSAGFVRFCSVRKGRKFAIARIRSIVWMREGAREGSRVFGHGQCLRTATKFQVQSKLPKFLSFKAHGLN